MGVYENTIGQWVRESPDPQERKLRNMYLVAESHGYQGSYEDFKTKMEDENCCDW